MDRRFHLWGMKSKWEGSMGTRGGVSSSVVQTSKSEDSYRVHPGR